MSDEGAQARESASDPLAAFFAQFDPEAEVEIAPTLDSDVPGMYQVCL